MNLNVRYLEEFVTLTEKNNFLEAAECLFISQSCLSKHIKKLEAEIGVELFERTTRTVVLTEFGQMLLPYARKMVSLEYELEKNVHRKILQDSGNIELGSIPTMKQHAITALIAGFLNELTANATKKDIYAGPGEATAIGNITAQMLKAEEFKTIEEARTIIHESFGVKVYK